MLAVLFLFVVVLFSYCMCVVLFLLLHCSVCSRYCIVLFVLVIVLSCLLVSFQLLCNVYFCPLHGREERLKSTAACKDGG